MDIERQVFSIFASFIQDLTLTFPEIKSCLYRNYEDSILAQNNDKKLDDYPKIKDFLDKIQKYEKMISDKDEQFFNLEIDFLEEISFKRLWEKQITDTNRATLWKYLQTFTIININLKSSQDLKNALESMGEKDELKKEEIKTKEVAKDLKKLKKLSEDVQQGVTEDEENELEELLSGFMDSGIGDIAKEVAENMNINEIFGSFDENSNPMDLMQQMMNPDKMGKIFQNIGSVMEQKKVSGDITDETLKKDAEKMYGSMSGNPMFSNMMQSMQSMSGGGVPENKSSDKSSDKSSEDQGLSKEEKRKKLKQKLKEKEEKRTKK
jgi:hypothetical protein